MLGCLILRLFQIELAPQPTYDYPPVIICPDAWLDTFKALSLGLSLNALNYSLGYYNLFDPISLENPSSAKSEFLSFFDKSNFSSLDDYYKAIAIDVAVASSVDDFGKPVPTLICPQCVVPLVSTKLFMDGGICFLFNLTAEDGSHSRRIPSYKVIGMKIADRTKKLLQVSSLWRLYISQSCDLGLKYPTSPIINMPENSLITVHVSVQRSQKLKHKESPCANADEVAANYSPEACYVQCYSDVYQKRYGCRRFDESVIHYRPSDYCNIFDKPPMDYWRLNAELSVQYETIIESPEGINCVRKCPYECDTMIYDVTMRSLISEDDLITPFRMITNLARSVNMSSVAVEVQNGAAYQGGIMTLTEVSTISFTSMVSNLGGALGLFVGGTMMTFVQVILFIIKYVMDRKTGPQEAQPSRDTIYSIM